MAQDDVARAASLLSLREAAHRYEVSLATLRVRARRGELAQVKVRGPWGPEWRVTAESIELLGYRLRSPEGQGARCEDHATIVARLERDLRAARRSAELERRHAEDVDRRLGEVMMECGRLRRLLSAPRTCANCGALLPPDRNAPVPRLRNEVIADLTVAEAAEVVSYNWQT